MNTATVNIYGKGGHGKMIASLLDHIKIKYNFFDDSDFNNAIENKWLIGIGDNINRKKVAENVSKNNPAFLTLNLSSYTGIGTTLSIGTVVAPGAIIQNNVKIGKHCIINTSASVDHDCEIGDYCHIAPNSTLCGDVKIGKGTLIGAGSVVLPGIEIGENCIIGAGSVVTKNIPSGSKAYGNPVKIK